MCADHSQMWLDEHIDGMKLTDQSQVSFSISGEKQALLGGTLTTEGFSPVV